MPASFPAATFTPSAKANGNTIQVTHVTDLDNEVVAIENDLRTGLSNPLTISVGGVTQSASTGSNNFAGPSSLATLQVNGTSTFTGAVTFSAVPTFSAGIAVSTFTNPVVFSSGLSVSTGIIRQNSLPSWSVYSTGTLAVGAFSSAGVSFDGQTFVRGGIGHSTATNSSRITINTTGVYQIGYSGLYNADGVGGAHKLYLKVNDSTNLYRFVAGRNSSQGGRTVAFSQPFRLDSTGYLTVVWVSSAAAPSTHGGSDALDRMTFSGVFIG